MRIQCSSAEKKMLKKRLTRREKYVPRDGTGAEKRRPMKRHAGTEKKTPKK